MVADRDPELSSVLDRARERGQLRAAKVLGGDDMLAANAFAEILGMTRVTERLGAPWAVYRFLVQRHGALDGLTGREALERGRGADAIAAAEGIARGDFT